jgi:hypothetical protein
MKAAIQRDDVDACLRDPGADGPSLDVFYKAEPPPCDACVSRQRCARERLACADFLRFARIAGRYAPSRTPRRDLYARLFPPAPPVLQRLCAYCGTTFETLSRTQRACSPSCRTALWRARHRALAHAVNKRRA